MNRSPPVVPTPSLTNLLTLEEANLTPWPCITNNSFKVRPSAEDPAPLKVMTSVASTPGEGTQYELITKKSYKYWPTDALSHQAFADSLSAITAACTNIWRIMIRFLTKVRRMIRDKPEWEDLPPELWGEIGKRLASRLDILRFRSVCEQWRISLPFPTLFPLRVPPLPPSYRCPCTALFITEVCTYRCKRVRALFGTEEVDQGGKFIGKTFAGFGLQFPKPKISFMRPGPYSQFYMTGKAYHLRTAKNVIIPSDADDDWRINPSCGDPSKLWVVAHLKLTPMKGRLALLRLHGAPENWVWDTDFCTLAFDVILAYRGRLWGVDSTWRLYSMDHKTLQMIPVCAPFPETRIKVDCFLFEYGRDLCLSTYACTYERRCVEQMGYRFCLRRQMWIKFDIEGDQGGPICALLPVLLDSPERNEHFGKR